MAAIDTLMGIDLGTTKINAIIAEVDETGSIQVVGVGNTPSRGMRRGVVVNIETTTDAIRTAALQAEQMAGVRVRDVLIGIAGDHIRSINSRGVIAVSRARTIGRSNVISKVDVERVTEAARAVSLPMDREVLHVLPQNYTVDDESGVRDPVGLTGLRLEADVHIITGAVASAQNIYRCVRRAGMGVRGLVLESLASSYSTVTDDEKELGVALLDLGGGTADLAVFYEGSIRHTAVVSLGGTNVSRDVAWMLGVPIDTAEKLKIEHGGIYHPDRDSAPIEVKLADNQKTRRVDPAELNSIIRARMEEIFDMVARELKRVDCMRYIASGIVITGGGSQLRGAVTLAEEVFGKTARIGEPSGLEGLADIVHNPSFATGVGLILYGVKHHGETMFSGDETAVFGRILKVFRGWFQGVMV